MLKGPKKERVILFLQVLISHTDPILHSGVISPVLSFSHKDVPSTDGL